MGRYAELQRARQENRADFRRLKEEMENNEAAFHTIGKEMEAIEQEPIRDSDVIVLFSSRSGADYTVYRITDRNREWVKERMEEIAAMDENARTDLNAEEYFREQGAEVMSILVSDGKGYGYPAFYDFQLDLDGARVVESTELSIKKQVENLINRIDFGEPVLNDSEWKLLHTYAEKTANMEDTYRLAQALRDTLHHPDFRVHEQVVEKARMEQEQAAEMSAFFNEEEKALFTGETDRFGIYQLKDGEELHYHHFASLDLLEKFGLKVEKGNYELIYTAPLQEGQTLDDIFEQFNLFRPEDFRGHSLSVSDIVLLHKNGENHARYLDRLGFVEVPQFLEPLFRKEAEKKPYIDHYYVVEDLLKDGPLDIKKYADIKEALQAYFALPNDNRKAFGIRNSNSLPGSLDFIQCYNGIDRMIFDYRNVEGWDNPEIRDAVEQIDVAMDLDETPIAYAIAGRYFTIQHTEEGFDYTFYNRNYHEIDGGVYDNTDLNIEEAMSEIMEDENLDYENGVVLNYESFMEHVEEANRVEPQKQFEEYFSVYVHSAAYAREHGELEQYRVSRSENIACKNDIETAIRLNFDGMYLQPDAAEGVLDIYGMERVVYVLSSSILQNEQDGRFSRENKEWAKTIPVAADMDSWERNQNIDFLVDSHPAVLDGFVHQVRKAQREAEKEALKIPPVSDQIEPEASLNQMSRADIEETVLAYAQSMVDAAGYDVKVTAARVYGSRTADIQREDSDVDVVVEYQGEIREDDFFNMLHEEGLSIGGMTVDINPVTAEKSGTIEEYLARANQFLEEKVKSFRETVSDQQKVKVVTELPVQTITFYVAECMEFPNLGEYHENLTFEEAVRLYEAIPAERMSAVKGIGFTLHTEGNEPYMDSSYELVGGSTIDVDMINHVPEFRNSPLVQQAVQDAIVRFPEMEVWDKETRIRENREAAKDFDKDCNELAEEIDHFTEVYNVYEYRDNVESKEENVNSIYELLFKGEDEGIREWLQEVIAEEEPAEDVRMAEQLLKKLDDLTERRERNPLAKVEELEEATYNQIDGVLNNIKPEKQEKKDTRGMSIMEKLALNKKRVAQADKPAKEPEKKWKEAWMSEKRRFK